MGFVHFLGALLAELIVMGSQKGHLFEKNMVLLCKQVNPLSTVVVLVLTIGIVVAGLIST